MSSELTGLTRRAAASAQVFVANLETPVLTADDDHHLARVLRLRAGESVVAADSSGRWRMCDYVGLGEGLVPQSEILVDDVPTSPIAVAFAPVKGDRPEWAFAKLVEQGVDIICLLMTDHSVVKWGDERAEADRTNDAR